MDFHNVRVADRIFAPVDQVWAIIGDFAHVARWNPLIERCDVVEEQGRMIRTAHFSEWWISERLDRKDGDAYRLDYTVVSCSRPEPVGSSVSIRLAADGPSATIIEWTAAVAPGLIQGLSDYYRQRLGHLRAALGLAS